MNRRDVLIAAIAAGAAVMTAEGIWWRGDKLISIPTGGPLILRDDTISLMGSITGRLHGLKKVLSSIPRSAVDIKDGIATLSFPMLHDPLPMPMVAIYSGRLEVATIDHPGIAADGIIPIVTVHSTGHVNMETILWLE